MLPELWEIPFIGYKIPSYGFMLTIGFLTGAYLAAKRGERVRVNPDMVLNLVIFAMVGSMIGARLFYIIHYWERDFAGRPNPLLAVIDFTKGGMEFYGGIVGALVLVIVYLLVKRESIRLYFDILTPSLMWGLAFGRMGCFLNGCCWGGLSGATVAVNWSAQFPYFSPAYVRQVRDNRVDLPDQLLLRYDQEGKKVPLPRQYVFLKPEEFRKYSRLLDQAKQDYEYLSKLDPGSKQVSDVKEEVERLARFKENEDKEYRALYKILDKHDSSEFPGQKITPSELATIASKCKSQPVHPAQVYGIINALFASLFLALLFRVRKRHGMVFAIWLMTYPWTRIILEAVRVDNPKDTFGLTISTSLSIFMIVLGIVLAVWFSRLPLHSPQAKPWEPPTEERAKPA